MTPDEYRASALDRTKNKMDFKPSPYVLAHERYAGYRGEAYAATAETVREWLHADGRDVRSLELSEIDETALECWEIAWPRFHPGAHYDGNFPWRAIAQQIRPTPRRFDLAIWLDFGLCGLCAGMASKNDAHVAINFIERFHGPNPLKGLIVPIAVECADAYAYILGKRTLKVRNPLDGVLPTYEALGFELVRPRKVAPYCVRGV
jgi:hypothetical protein